MNKDRLAVLTPMEKLMVKTAKNIGLNGVVQLLTALADARLEVARLKKLRDKVVEGNQRIVQRNLDLESEVARLTAAVEAAQPPDGDCPHGYFVGRDCPEGCTDDEGHNLLREDIQRLLAAAEAVCAKACLTGRKGEDGWTYQVGRDGDAALRALAGIRDEFAAKYTEGSGMRLDDMTHHVGDDCPGGHVAGLRGLKETLITVAPDWTELLTEEERGGWLDRTGPGYARLHQTLGTVATLRALVEEKDKALMGLQAAGRDGRMHFAFCPMLRDYPSYASCADSCQAQRGALALDEDEMRKRLEAK